MGNSIVSLADGQRSNPTATNGGFGMTEDLVDTPSDGPKIWNRVKSLMGRSFEIRVGHILLVVGMLALTAGFLMGIKVEQSRFDSFLMNGNRYYMVGVSQVPGYPDIYIPVYKRTKEVR